MMCVGQERSSITTWYRSTTNSVNYWGTSRTSPCQSIPYRAPPPSSDTQRSVFKGAYDWSKQTACHLMFLFSVSCTFTVYNGGFKSWRWKLFNNYLVNLCRDTWSVYKDSWMQFCMSVSFQLNMYNSFPVVNQCVFIMSDYCTFILLPLEGP